MYMQIAKVEKVYGQLKPIRGHSDGIKIILLNYFILRLLLTFQSLIQINSSQ